MEKPFCRLLYFDRKLTRPRYVRRSRAC